MPRCASSSNRLACCAALAACARSRSRLACACCSAASSGRRSSVNRTWPGRDVVAFGEVDARSAGRWSARGWRRVENGSAAPMTLISIGIDFWTTVPTATGTAGAPPRPPRPFPGAADAAAPSSPAQPATMSWTSANRMMAGVRMRPMSPSRYSMILVEPHDSWTGRCSTMEGRNGYSINAGPGAGDWPARAEAMA